ncbi:MAG: 3-demethylubiquinone-9 3-methyltransferase [Gammaproteobacteria bacterium BRH_c0]|nr:MAG: 3-demethylubiquinone-9 3-methyltransferase [Gammaproteobacteria bacterium BRH_c0]
MTVTPYLTFNGNCREAFAFYAGILNGKVDMMTHGESPFCDQMPKALHDTVMHAQLTAGDLFLMGADAPPDMYQKPGGICVAMAVASVEEAEHLFSALSAGGVVQMPIAETFWAHRFGMFTDRFDIPWMINCLKCDIDLKEQTP